ncbi:UDP-glucuronate decarboxylase [Devosia sp. UYZn731]|uniref:UDP-glucuronic acid decarboxylase family protein n=1 Tax=Devosia sp. UYZn731 TaxID=3156345 RepID=UPI00339ABD9F
MSRTILVTGGAGFIGSHLCQALIDRGDGVVCLDNFSTGDRANIAHLLDNKNFSVLVQDVAEPITVEVDEIYNLACPASPVHYQRDPVQTTRTCVLGAISVLELARKLGVPVLQASTSEIYGDPEVHPQIETYVGHVNPIGPRACYDEGKRCAETLFFDYHRQYDTKIKIARIFNTYGPNMAPDDGRVVSNFIVQALSGNPLTIHGTGSQTRSFCYVDDTVAALIALMDTPKGVTGPINIGNPEEHTVRGIAEMIVAAIASSSSLDLRPLPEDDPRRRRPDINLALTVLNWSPTISLNEGLARTIDYFRGEGAPARKDASAF